MSPGATVKTTVEGRELTVSNLDKVLYPKSGFTKGQMLDYYRESPAHGAPPVRPTVDHEAISGRRPRTLLLRKACARRLTGLAGGGTGAGAG